MTFRVLQSWQENRAARQTLIDRGLSYWPERPPPRLRDRLRRRAPIQVGELNKSWDVLLTLELLEREGLRDEAIIDLGAFASETPCVLHRAGFKRLTGIDFNPRIRAMPFADEIQWLVGDATDTKLPGASFAAVTAISSIEHGPSPTALVREAARLLRPGGLFVGSTDYWADKIDTRDTPMFRLEWRIFSADEIRRLVDDFRAHGLEPLGDVELSCGDAPIDCAGRLYTFGWFAFRRR